MPKPTNPNDYELRDEYDFSKMSIVPKGRFAPKKRIGNNVVVLDADLAKAFPNDEAVNSALYRILRRSPLPLNRSEIISMEEKNFRPWVFSSTAYNSSNLKIGFISR